MAICWLWLAAVYGKVSGGLEVLDFDNRFNRAQELKLESGGSAYGFTVLFTMFLGPLIQASGAYRLLDFDLPYTLRAIGLMAAASSLILLHAGYRDLGPNWAQVPSVPRFLVTKGVYAHVRHPIYSAALLWCFGQGLCLANWLTGVLCPALLVFMLLARTAEEERILRQVFGRAYAQYSWRVPRFLPRLTVGNG